MTKRAKKILVADDDTAILESISLLLEMNNYTVITSTGEDVIGLIKQQQPDVVLLDIWRGMIDGKDVCKAIKADRDASRVPVILVSASNDIKHSYSELGASDYIEKPFDIDALVKKIEIVTKDH
jgi:DNA-binding response OmpR family regulator